MSEILSQTEIDALLSALQSGEVDVEAIKHEENMKKIRNYDFRRPNKFSKDQLNTIEVIYENFCRLLTTFLSGTLRNRVIAKVASVDQVTYDEFVRSIPNPTILNVFSMEPLEGKGILELNPIIGFSMIDRLLGGPGLGTLKGRTLTEIERSVTERTVEKILFFFGDAWKSLLEIETVLESIEINPQFTQIVSPREMVVIIAIEIKIGDTEGFINICLPCLMLEPIAMKLNTKFWFASSTRHTPEDKSEYVKRVIKKTFLPLSVSLEKNSITVRELLGLQVGDVIELEHKKNQDVEIYVGPHLKYYGAPGLMGNNKMAVRINKLYQEEGSEDYE